MQPPLTESTVPDPRPAERSRCVMTEFVLPNDTNGLGNLMGGRLLHLMDKCAAVSAMRHTGRVCVTASVDSVEFQAPIREGEVVVVESQVNRAFRTSMEIELHVWGENPLTGERRKSNRAFYTFVSLDSTGRPTPAPDVNPQTDAERERYAAAGRRREIRLILSGRLDLDSADQLREHLEDLIHHPDDD